MKAKSKPDKQSKINTPIVVLAYLVAILLWIFISLSNSYQTTVAIPFQLVNLPHGFSSSSPLPETVQIKLKTTGWRLLSMQLSSSFVFQVSGYQLGETGKVNLKDVVSENQWMSDDVKILDVNPESVRIDFEKTVSKSKRIALQYEITYKEGYGLARQPLMVPESVTVFGSRKLLNQVDSIISEKFVLQLAEKPVSEEIQLKPVNGVQIQPDKIRVFFDIQRIVENKIENIPVEILNVPPDRKVVLSPGEISIGVRGGIEYIGRVKPGDCKAFVEYKDIIADSTGYIEPQVKIPDYIKKMFIEPQRIKTIIKKY